MTITIASDAYAARALDKYAFEGSDRLTVRQARMVATEAVEQYRHEPPRRTPDEIAAEAMRSAGFDPHTSDTWAKGKAAILHAIAAVRAEG